MGFLPMDAYCAIEEARKIKGTKSKVKFLKEHMTDELRYVIEHTVSPYINFGLKPERVTFHTPLDTDGLGNSEPWRAMIHVLHKLKSTQLTGNAAIDGTSELTKHLNYKQQHILQLILGKDLKCGIGTKTANQIMPNLIKEFSIQLASPSKEKKPEFPCIVEKKINGIRSIAVISNKTVTHFSRSGKMQEGLDFLDIELIRIADGMDLVFDGEIHGISKDHRKSYEMAQETVGCKKSVDTSKILYTVFDMMPTGAWERQAYPEIQANRSVRLLNLVKDYHEHDRCEHTQVMFSRQRYIDNEGELLKIFNRVTKRGGEGLIVKDPKGVYSFKRDKSWIKYKCNETSEFKIVDVIEGKGKLKGAIGSVVVKTKGGTSNCGLKGITHEEAKKMWKSRKKMIGKKAEVEYMNITPDGNLYLPKFLHIRKKE